ncbi:hypothetical protein QBC39DRAFT_258121 [Podospora conica]|nr:hypothetical protein QBC39DRAFT_258121 [Schizothecium conicum]
MPAKRKRDPLEGFDPNKSDSEDENFNPAHDAPPRSSKKSRSTKGRRTSGGAARNSRQKRGNKYRGSDIEDDDDEIAESDLEESFGDDDEEEEEDDAPTTATGRRKRQAAVKHPSYKESSGEEEPERRPDSDDSPAEEMDEPKPPARKPTRLVTLKVPKSKAEQVIRPRRGKEEHAAAPVTRRATRARTEETEEPLLELSNSGRHAAPQSARDSRSRSPEALARAARATRGNKGLKKLPEPIPEATQETDPKEVDDPLNEADELAPSDTEESKKTFVGDEQATEPQQADDSVDQVMDDAPAEPAEVQAADDEDDDDDDIPITRRTRGSQRAAAATTADEDAEPEAGVEPEAGTGRRGRPPRASRLRSKKNMQEPSSDFEPHEESADEHLSASDASPKKGRKASAGANESSGSTPSRGRGTRGRGAKKTRRSQVDSGEEDEELDKDEMAAEAEELRQSSHSRARRRRRSPSIQYEEPISKKRRTAKPVNYSIQPFDNGIEAEEDDVPTQTPAKGRKGGASQAWERNFNTTYGPFGGGGGTGSLLGGPWGTGATGGVDSDSSDDETAVRRPGVGGTVGMTPTSAVPPLGLFNAAMNNAEGGAGATPNVGKVKNQKMYADADPLGVDMSVDFSQVGGLQGHVEQLKEMVQLPLLYPELFSRFNVTPPRGVLFHGPPGTGKTLLARALANSIGSGGRKVSFYMRKGADALSKWVGEAEKQLRLLFEEARRTQPSIIFFDEIDGLAPVRSSKQEQIHASIVSTLLALMDGMDGRGQVIVIGATNRPDNIDPALRRPGRFDREFYFPLPDKKARRAIIDIHTKDWGLSDVFKDSLAENTKGYGGADLRALSTEAALNAIQRTYPQIYQTRERLLVDPSKIDVHASDFMISIKKIVPSSQRSAATAATPLPRLIEPLLKDQYEAMLKVLNNVMPRPKKVTALEEAMFEQYQDADHGFAREEMHQEFERSRIFRPRLLICGTPGMGQNYLASAVLHYMEGVHVQNFDLATLLGDGRPLDQVIVSMFVEVKRHKPSVIYIPHVDTWWETMPEATLRVFVSMLKSIPPSDPVLLLATCDAPPNVLDPNLLQELFGFSKKNRAFVDRPDRECRVQFFQNIISHLRKSPTEFPDPAGRKKRVLEELPVAPPPPPKTLTKEEVKEQRKLDLHHLNLLKMRLQPIMDQIQKKYRKFRTPVIPFASISYLFDETDPNFVRADVAEGPEVRPYELAKDKDGTDGIRDTTTGKFFYNLETTTIEERLANGFYARPEDFYTDINRLYLDSKNAGQRERTLKANELRTNVEVDVHEIGQILKAQGIRYDEIYERQLQRAKEAEEKAKKRMALQPFVDLANAEMPDGDSDSQGPVGVGIQATTGARFMVMSPRSNGHVGTSQSHPATNGTSVPSRSNGDDVVMSDINFDSPAPASQASPFQFAKPPLRPLTDSTRATAGTQVSQRSAVTALPPGVSPSAVLNDASTTKTSDPSTNRGSGNWSTQPDTQRTNGLNSNADQETQLVDTQSQNRNSGPSQTTGTSSERDWAHSQAAGLAQGLIQPRMGGANINPFPNPAQSQQHYASEDNTQTSPQQAPRKSAASLDNILNDTTSSSSALGGGPPTPSTAAGHGPRPSGSTTSGHSSQQPVIHEQYVHGFLEMLVNRTSGCSIEQLEQINRELMDEIWHTRGEWNRMTVLSRLTSVFNDTIGDIELVQGGLEGSQASQSQSQAVSLLEGGGGGGQKAEQPFIYLRREEEETRGSSQLVGVGGTTMMTIDESSLL